MGLKRSLTRFFLYAKLPSSPKKPNSGTNLDEEIVRGLSGLCPVPGLEESVFKRTPGVSSTGTHLVLVHRT